MINTNITKYIALLSTLLVISACENRQAPTREAIVAKFPNVDAGSSQAENSAILCPFLRMLERAGLFEDEPDLIVPARKVTDGAVEFGCGRLECGGVASVVSISQAVGGVDLQRLHEAPPVSHDCGLTFGLGETQVNNDVRQATLDRLQQLADANGRLVFSDIETVKLEICAAQGVNITAAGETEIKLIYAYLGGVDNGFVMYSDVEKLLHAEMPATKTTEWVDAGLLNRVN